MTVKFRERARIQPAEQPISPPVFLTVREAAELLRLSEVTLARWRIQGGGPAYRKFGRRVVYSRSDLTAWANGQTRQSTSER
jgi:excisionase family DNA binding protein